MGLKDNPVRGWLNPAGLEAVCFFFREAVAVIGKQQKGNFVICQKIQ